MPGSMSADGPATPVVGSKPARLPYSDVRPVKIQFIEEKENMP